MMNYEQVEEREMKPNEMMHIIVREKVFEGKRNKKRNGRGNEGWNFSQ